MDQASRIAHSPGSRGEQLHGSTEGVERLFKASAGSRRLQIASQRAL